MMRGLFVIGTRPEVIKMAPVVRAFRERNAGQAIVCMTGQHREMVSDAVEYFNIKPDLDLGLMVAGQSVGSLLGRCITAIDQTIARLRPDFVIAQGDTQSVLGSSMAAFLNHVPFFHVEAGLRTGNLQSPWPEEMNRRVIAINSTLHFAPTSEARQNLLAEQIPDEKIVVTGNTVVDAVRWTAAHEATNAQVNRERLGLADGAKMVLITAHRRENIGKNLNSICEAVASLCRNYPSLEFIFTLHLNRDVRSQVTQFFQTNSCRNIRLVEPLSYPLLVWVMTNSELILTDSGGIQEEAPALGKRVLVLRDTTERPEGLSTGLVFLVGTTAKAILEKAEALIQSGEGEIRPSAVYGDGRAGHRICSAIAEHFTQSN